MTAPQRYMEPLQIGVKKAYSNIVKGTKDAFVEMSDLEIQAKKRAEELEIKALKQRVKDQLDTDKAMEHGTCERCAKQMYAHELKMIHVKALGMDQKLCYDCREKVWQEHERDRERKRMQSQSLSMALKIPHNKGAALACIMNVSEYLDRLAEKFNGLEGLIDIEYDALREAKPEAKLRWFEKFQRLLQMVQEYEKSQPTLDDKTAGELEEDLNQHFIRRWIEMSPEQQQAFVEEVERFKQLGLESPDAA